MRTLEQLDAELSRLRTELDALRWHPDRQGQDGRAHDPTSIEAFDDGVSQGFGYQIDFVGGSVSRSARKFTRTSYGTLQDEGTALTVRAILNVISAIAQAGDNVSSTRTDLYIHARHYAAIVDSGQATQLDSGTSTSVTTTTLTDTGKSWTASQWVGYRVVITNGASSGKSATITANTATVLTFGTITGLTGTPTYSIEPDTNCFRRLTDALKSGARSIFYRAGADTGTVTWASTDTCDTLVGDSSRSASIGFTLDVDKSDFAIDGLNFGSGAQLRIGVSASVTGFFVSNCVFATGATGAVVIGQGADTSLGQLFGCTFDSLTATAVNLDPGGAAFVGRIALVGCIFDSCGTASSLLNFSSTNNAGAAVISCLFSACTNATIVSCGANPNQVVTANRFINGSGVSTVVTITGTFCQFVGNFIVTAASEATICSVGQCTVNGNMVTMSDKSSGTQIGIAATGRTNCAGNYILFPSSKSGTATLEAFRITGHSVIITNNTVQYSALSAPTGALVGVQCNSYLWIITGNTFFSGASSGTFTGINIGSTANSQGIIDNNIYNAGSAGLFIPTPWTPVSGATGLTTIGNLNVGIWREQHIRDFEDDFEGNALDARWTTSGSGTVTAGQTGLGRSACRLATGAVNDQAAIIDLRPANVTENATIGSSDAPEFVCIFKLNQTANLKCWIGLWDAAPPTGDSEPANFEGIHVASTASAGTWQMHRRVASVTTDTSLSQTQDTSWHIAVFRRTNAGIEVIWDGTARTAATTAIPSADLFFGVKLLTDETVDKTMDLDRAKFSVGR